LNSHALPDPAQRLEATLLPATHALLLVSDGAIPELLRRYPMLHEKTLVHCSGSQAFPGVAGAHPLMTFSHDLYSPELYRRIPFMVDSGYAFRDVLPGFPNPHYSVSLGDKPRYHALCVMAGNFSQILWQTASRRFLDMGLPPAALLPYLEQVSTNFADSPDTALTGPLSREDNGTVERNLNALEDDPLHEVYQAFVNLYHAEQPSRLSTARTREAAS
jgi:predicted short-subunit dehydrogenase-like oxidoreductase (DUF2520 family)